MRGRNGIENPLSKEMLTFVRSLCSIVSDSLMRHYFFVIKVVEEERLNEKLNLSIQAKFVEQDSHRTYDDEQQRTRTSKRTSE